MYSIKGFAQNSAFIDNTVGNVNPIGEMSKESMTYSTELGEYSNNAISQQITFMSTLSNLNGTTHHPQQLRI